jgi:MFS transporter, FSR family, fosmidomycin resistance protein
MNQNGRWASLKNRMSGNRAIIMLSAGHFMNDGYPGFVAPLLPLLMGKIGFSLTLAGTLVSIQAVSTSLTQPVFGLISDRLRRPLLVILGPLCTAIFFSSIGLVQSYSLLATIIILGGLGTAAFHPQAASLTSQYSGGKKGLPMAVFVTAGNAGHGLGPIFILSVVTFWGLHNSWVLVIWGILISFLLWRFLPKSLPQKKPVEHTFELAQTGNRKSALLLIWLLVFMRAFVIDCYLAFNPIFLHEKQFSVLLAGAANTVFELCGASGTLLGGPLSDRFGRKKIILFSFLLPLPFILLFLSTAGTLALLFLAVAGFILFSSVPVTIIMAQELYPHRSGAVSSLTMGFAWGIAGLLITPFAAWSDHIGLQTALTHLAMVLPVAVLLTAKLPADFTHRVKPDAVNEKRK